MIRLLRSLYRILASRALTPIVIGIFLLLYIGIAFFTEEALIILIGIAKTSVILIVLFSLIPLNRLLRLFVEVKGYLDGRRALQGRSDAARSGLFDETVEVGTLSSFSGVERRLVASGYTTHGREDSLSAWRGVTTFPARLIFLAATVCLFSGILLSLGGRVSFRDAVVEGEPFPTPTGTGGMVERIALDKSTKPFLGKTLAIEVAPANSDEQRAVFGLYPPLRYDGAFVYPRYLGLKLLYRFSAPDLPTAYEASNILKLYPPGKEDRKEIPGSPYRLVFSLVRPEDGTDPYMTGRMTIFFKLLKGDDVVASGSAPRGGEFVGNGYRLGFPDIRRVVITDFIRDRGVFLIWTAGMMFVLAVCVWLPIRSLFPRREMVFVTEGGRVRAYSRAEGRRRRHAGVFHEALDLLESERQEREPGMGDIP